MNEEISVKAAAAILGRTERAVQALAKRGRLPGRQVGPYRKWRLDKAAVIALKQARDEEEGN